MNYVSKAELAKMGRVTRQRLTQYCRKGEEFHHAVNDEGMVDAEDEIILDWLKERNKGTSPDKLSSKEYEHLTVKDIKDRYGSITKLESFIKVRKMIVETEHKQIQMEATREELVSRKFVGKACFGIVESCNLKLLDMPKGIVEIIGAILKTEVPGSREEAEQTLTKEVSRIIKNAKKEICERLNVEMAELEKAVNEKPK